MGEHTDTPWGYEYIGDKPPGHFASDKATIGFVGDFRIICADEQRYDGHAADAQDAKFIVEAVNSYDRSRATIAALVGALERAKVLCALVTVSQAISAGNGSIEASGLNPWAMNEGLADGTERISTHFIDSALLLARGSKNNG